MCRGLTFLLVAWAHFGTPSLLAYACPGGDWGPDQGGDWGPDPAPRE